MEVFEDIKLINESSLKFKGYNIVSLSQVFLFKSKYQKDKKSFSQFLKVYIFDNITKSLISFRCFKKRVL